MNLYIKNFWNEVIFAEHNKQFIFIPFTFVIHINNMTTKVFQSYHLTILNFQFELTNWR